MDVVGTGPVLPTAGLLPAAPSRAAAVPGDGARLGASPAAGTAPTAPTLLPLVAQREQLRPPVPPVMTGAQMTALLRMIISGGSMVPPTGSAPAAG